MAERDPPEGRTMNTVNGVIRVGKGGRGFVVAGKRDRFVITASHCLPKFPPRHPAAHYWERTYAKLLGPLGGRYTVMAECLFVDPVADLAVLGPPDNQALYEQAEAYEALTESVTPMVLADLPLTGSSVKRKLPNGGEIAIPMPRKGEGPARLLSLDGKWFACRLTATERSLWIWDAEQPIVGGMSGSPIVNDTGAAVGVCCTAGGLVGHEPREGGPNPFLTRQLPGWFLDEIKARR
jgi:hypothetical protein